MEHLKELLKQKFSGIRPDVLAHLAASLAMVATTEEEQKAMVEKLTDAQVEAFGKDYRKAVDAEVSNGTKTFEDNLKKKYDFVEKGKKQDPTPAPQPAQETKPQPQLNDEIKELLKSQQATIEELKSTIATMQKDGVSKVRSTRYGEILKGCKDENLKSILERQLPLLQSLDDDAFNAQLDTLKSDVEKSNQLYAERSLPQQTFTKRQPVDENKVSASMKAYVEKMNGETKKQ